jgi:hypothetical protein
MANIETPAFRIAFIKMHLSGAEQDVFNTIRNRDFFNLGDKPLNIRYFITSTHHTRGAIYKCLASLEERGMIVREERDGETYYDVIYDPKQWVDADGDLRIQDEKQRERVKVLKSTKECLQTATTRVSPNGDTNRAYIRNNIYILSKENLNHPSRAQETPSGGCNERTLRTDIRMTDPTQPPVRTDSESTAPPRSANPPTVPPDPTASEFPLGIDEETQRLFIACTGHLRDYALYRAISGSGWLIRLMDFHRPENVQEALRKTAKETLKKPITNIESYVSAILNRERQDNYRWGGNPPAKPKPKLTPKEAWLASQGTYTVLRNFELQRNIPILRASMQLVLERDCQGLTLDIENMDAEAFTIATAKSWGIEIPDYVTSTST